jgi:hypothetical protein
LSQGPWPPRHACRGLPHLRSRATSCRSRVQENAICGGLTSCGRNAQHRLRRVMSREVPPCGARSA